MSISSYAAPETPKTNETEQDESPENQNGEEADQPHTNGNDAGDYTSSLTAAEDEDQEQDYCKLQRDELLYIVLYHQTVAMRLTLNLVWLSTSMNTIN